MISLESITPGLSLTGLDPTGIGSVIAVVPIADGVVQVLYKTPDGVHKVDCSDLIRRMVKEKLVKFDGTPLFPERRAYAVNYQLSDLEAALYEAVTDYVKTEMGKAGLTDRITCGIPLMSNRAGL